MSVGIPITTALPGLVDLWSRTKGEASVRIAVLDGPLDRAHPVLASALIIESPTVSPDPAQEGARVHGTHTASLIVGAADSAAPGVAPGCTILSVPIFQAVSDQGRVSCTQLDLARGINVALQQGAHVINISGGQLDQSGEPEPLLAAALAQASQAGALVVAAAGNDGCECLHVPASTPSVIAVGAVGQAGQPLASSNWGRRYMTNGVLAPGEGILAAEPGNRISSGAGTSWAAPIVSGVLGLILSLQRLQQGQLDTAAAKELLFSALSTCDPTVTAQCEFQLRGILNIPNILRIMNKEQSAMDLETEQAVAPSAEAEARVEVSAPPTEIAPQAPPRPVPTAPAAAPEASVTASDCGCGCGGDDAPAATVPAMARPALVYALGVLGYDFGTESRHDSFVQHGVTNPFNPAAIIAHLAEHPSHTTALTWTLMQESTAIYAILPAGPFAQETYAALSTALDGQLQGSVEQVSIPGIISGSTTLMNGQNVPVIYPELRGIYSWSTSELVKATQKAAGKNDNAEEVRDGVYNFLERIYFELRNFGMTSPERAINYAATNAFQVENVFRHAAQNDLHLDQIEVERSPICRPGADCWDVKLSFFNPKRRLEEARRMYRFTIDVSDIVPVTVGKIRAWHVY